MRICVYTLSNYNKTVVLKSCVNAARIIYKKKIFIARIFHVTVIIILNDDCYIKINVYYLCSIIIYKIHKLLSYEPSLS